MLVLSQVSKRYGDTLALAPTDLQVPTGETLVLIGPSGCGKSTLLRLIVGLIQPDSGTITLDGEALTPANIDQARQRMGYVIQEGGLFPHLTVRDNVVIMARHLRRATDWIDSRLTELAQLVLLPQELMSRFPAELSGGQRQRVSLMRALMLDPELLLLDEPLGALDPMIRYELQQELKSIFGQLGKTVIMVTHDIAEAAFFGHTLVLMRNGRIVQTGPFKALAKRGLRMTHPLDFNNTYTIGMKDELAAQLNINTISDLRDHPELVLGFGNEFMDRADGWPGLQRRYQLPHRNVRGLDHDLAYRGIESGALQATDLYATDAEIAYYNLGT